MHTYFVATHNRVKIGRSASPPKRIKSLQTAQPEPLRVLLVLEGDREREMHDRFSRHRRSGEWFNLDDEILDFIDECSHRRKAFRRWLMDQRKRPWRDEVGLLAFMVAREPKLSRASYVSIRKHFVNMPRWRRVAKDAHRQWLDVLL